MLTSRKWTILLAGLAAVLIAAAAASRSRRFVRAYFRFEQACHAENLTPVLCKIGILHPVRLTVEPGVSFLLDPRDLVPLTILRTGEWQPEIWEALLPNLREGSVFLDVGAHIGYFSMKAARKVGRTGRVLSFEPNPETLKLLNDNVARNHAENITVEPVACTEREQTLTLYAAPVANTGASSLARSNAEIAPGESAHGYQVRGRPIDDVVRELNLQRVDAIKVDVEGAEVSVLRGAANTLKRFHPKLIIEVVPAQLASFQTTPEDIASWLREAGYNRSRRLRPEENDWEWTLQEPGSMASVVQISDISTADQLISGFHGLERNAWRWTDRKFTFALRRPPGADQAGGWLTLKFTIPAVSLEALKSITVTAKVGGAAVAPETFTSAGDHEYRREVPASALSAGIVNVEFSLDKVLPPSQKDGRELGVVVTSAGLESK